MRSRADDVFFLPAVEMAQLIRRREISPVELIERLFDRIESIDVDINAYCTLAVDQALAAAQAAEQAVLGGEELGPLHGVPISVKDNLETAGLRTTYGSRVFEHHVPTEDHIAVARLRAVGAIVVGKTNLPEFAAKAVTDSPLFGWTRNPWSLDRTAGGSSGGAAAAVAAGLGPIGLGTDVMGSIRIPASCCGVIGLKPTAGRIPRFPSETLWETADQVGPIARAVEDIDVCLRVISGPDPRDPLSLPPIAENFERGLGALARGWRCAWSPDLGFARVDPDVLEIASSAAMAFGAIGTVVRAHIDLHEAEDANFTLGAIRQASVMADVIDAWRDRLDERLVERVYSGMALTPEDLGRATRKRQRVHAAVEGVFEEYDLLLTPTIAVAPFQLGREAPPLIDGRPPTSARDWYPFAYPFNLTGHPAASVPAGWTRDRLPVGLQIVGRRFADRDVLAACRYLEQVRPWAEWRPPVAERGLPPPA